MTENLSNIIPSLLRGEHRAFARAITLVENEVHGFRLLMESLPPNNDVPVLGITGPPGAGKSTLVDGLIGEAISREKKVAVICVDPSSPFHRGAVLGDRIRMSQWYTHPLVFIRSVASRGSQGGMSEKMVEIAEVIKAAAFDYVLIETVGVGQIELEITGLADITMVVLAPESGDEIQAMKAGIMEIADIFVVNKSDRPQADQFVRFLKEGIEQAAPGKRETPVLKTVATRHEGLPQLWQAIAGLLVAGVREGDKFHMMALRAYQIIRHRRMQNITLEILEAEVRKRYAANQFNLYQLVESYL